MAPLKAPEGPHVIEPLGSAKQLLNHTVDDITEARPSAVWAEIPISTTSCKPGFRKITYSLFVNAINGVAWWMHQTLGPGQEFETLAYFAPWDIRYTLLLLGAIKSGYKMVLPSPGYSIAGLAVLLDELHCKTVLAPSASPAIVPAFLALHPRKLVIVQEIEELLAKTYPHFAFEKTFESARHEPLVVLHTSGSTSHPKPVVWFTNLFATITNRTTTIYPLPSAALSADTLVDILVGKLRGRMKD